jgi:hypothetical protein
MAMHAPNPRCGLLLLAAALAGCSSSTSYMVPIAGGQKAEASIGKNGMVMLQDDMVRIEEASLRPAKDRKGFIFFLVFAPKPGFVPKSVKIEDVTEDPVTVVCEDRDPKLQKGYWISPGTERDIHDPAIHWLLELDDSMRIYRFTITGADGRAAVLDQASMVPSSVKAFYRKLVGIAY